MAKELPKSTIKNIIADIIDDRAELIIEYGQDPYINNTPDLADMILQAIKDFENGRRPYQ